MKLSIIIVNYNVRYFLEQCLNSVQKAVSNIDAEIFVVDNNSKDDSVEMVEKNFPTVKIIANKINLGFSKANNQAIELAKGEYILLLNPDTVVEEDAFSKCIEFMDKNSDAGGLGVKMIDGNGVFLPESKRGLPTPSASFYKIFGLSTLFPKSKLFSKYHLGYLKPDKINEIEILSGAYMWMRKSVLDKVGVLDESFFMYGEDIDLSYRIIKAGYKNYYFPETKIIHYKGESTKKGSLNYVFVFYNAMIIFSKKHFAQKAKAFSFFINIAIYIRAILAITTRVIRYFSLPLIDIVLMILMLGILNFIKPYIGFPNRIELSNSFGIMNILLVFISYLFGLILSKSYSSTINISRTYFGLLIGTFLFFGINTLFPIEHSFSTKFISTIALGMFLFIPTSRILLHYFNKLKVQKDNKKTILINGDADFINNLKNQLIKMYSNVDVFAVKTSNLYENGDESVYVGKSYQLNDIAEIYYVTDVFFSSNNVTYKQIINFMDNSKNNFTEFKISLNNNCIISSKNVEIIN